MRASSRSTPAGEGSRGGHWHEPAYRSAYYRQWRKDHPEYREREQQRSLKRSIQRQYDRMRDENP